MTALDWAESRAAGVIKLMVDMISPSRIDPATCAVWIDLIADQLRVAHQEGVVEGIAKCDLLVRKAFAKELK